MAKIRELAGEILRQDFPNIRQPRQVAASRKQNKATVIQEGHRARQLPDVAAKLAKLAKTPRQKGKNIR